MAKERKAEIIEQLGAAYAETRLGITRMEYLKDLSYGAEIVVVYGKDDTSMFDILVTGDSGAQMIFDVVEKIENELVRG